MYRNLTFFKFFLDYKLSHITMELLVIIKLHWRLKHIVINIICVMAYLVSPVFKRNLYSLIVFKSDELLE